MEWNERLAQTRKALGLSQEQVVTAMRRWLPEKETVGIAALSSWEQGRTQPRVLCEQALARVLDALAVAAQVKPKPGRQSTTSRRSPRANKKDHA